MDLQELNKMKTLHNEIASEIFIDGVVTWSRIITLISFSAFLAERVIQQQPNDSSRNLIITSLIDWTTNFIDTDLHTWLQSENYWVNFFNIF